MKNKGFAHLVVILGIFIIGAVVVMFLLPKITNAPVEPTSNPVGVACTMEAKLCPDGSNVGRSGPNCEFAACPATKSTIEPRKTALKTYIDNNIGFSFQYSPTITLNTEPQYPDTADGNITVWSEPGSFQEITNGGLPKIYSAKNYMINNFQAATFLQLNSYDTPISPSLQFVISNKKYIVNISLSPNVNQIGRDNPDFFLQNIDQQNTVFFVNKTNGREFADAFEKGAVSPSALKWLDDFNQIKDTFKFTYTALPTCKPRPACLDSTPHCMIPETADMCPPPAK